MRTIIAPVFGVSPWRSAALAAVVAALLGAGAPAAAADAPQPNPVQRTRTFLGADITQPGVVSLFFFGAEGARVVYYERVGAQRRRLGARSGAAPGAPTVLRDAVTWQCAPLQRRFIATATLPDGRELFGTYSVRTPSCASRFELRAPRRVQRGKVGRIRVFDRWEQGGARPDICLQAPRQERTCEPLRFRRAVAIVTHRFRPAADGRWRVQLRFDRHVVRGSVQVGRGEAPAAARILLAAGDSLMQVVDSFLADELGETATVRSDARPGFGISKTDETWARVAQQQVKKTRPSVTAVFIGATEGPPMTTLAGGQVECCGEPWELEYSRRVRVMMESYRQRGKGRVLWLTVPIPRGPRLVADAVNRAILRAAEGQAGVRVLRMDLLFTPDGFADVIRYRGRDVRVREADGIHLNVAGAAIAANVVADALREK